MLTEPKRTWKNCSLTQKQIFILPVNKIDSIPSDTNKLVKINAIGESLETVAETKQWWIYWYSKIEIGCKNHVCAWNSDEKVLFFLLRFVGKSKWNCLTSGLTKVTWITLKSIRKQKNYSLIMTADISFNTPISTLTRVVLTQYNRALQEK